MDQRVVNEADHGELRRLFDLWERGSAMQSHGHGGHALLLWDGGTEVKVTGDALVDLLLIMRDHYLGQVIDARAALTQHGIGADGLSVADQIHLLVGRRERARR